MKKKDKNAKVCHLRGGGVKTMVSSATGVHPPWFSAASAAGLHYAYQT